MDRSVQHAEPSGPRRGARRLVDVDPALLSRLEAGCPAATHIEQMAIRMDRLLDHAFPEAANHPSARTLGDLGFVHRMRAVGRVLAETYGTDAIELTRASPSDTVRGWGAFATALLVEADGLVAALAPFADDPHFSVREMAWLALRPTTCSQTGETIAQLAPLARDKSNRLRRFACEATRPRGVWSAHVPALKHDPSSGLTILEPLRADPDPYVRTSVGNWLNDAGKDQPAWVIATIDRWRGLKPPVVEAIARRALSKIRRFD